jgi:hypothetical protein
MSKESLVKELRSLIPKLDEEGLAFLVKQAHIHLYNLQVDALNKQALVISQKKTAAKSAGKKAASAGQSTAKTEGFSGIKASDSGSSYYLGYKNEWIMLSRDEMTQLVKIARGKGTIAEIKERLFNWLVRERTDILRSAAVANKSDDKLKSLAGLLKKH